MNSVDFIVTAKHYAEREGAASVRARILKRQGMMQKNLNIPLQVKGIDAPNGVPVSARIWQGQWIADCECGGAEFVDPDEPIFYCFSCGNRENNNYVRPVTFPEQREEIEAAVLARPVDDAKGLTDLERAGLAKPAVVVIMDGLELPLLRSWRPEESLDELMAQNSVLNGLTVEKGTVVMVDATPTPLSPTETSPQMEELNLEGAPPAAEDPLPALPQNGEEAPVLGEEVIGGTNGI